MKPRTGVDIIAIERIEKAMTKSGDPFLERIFTTKERAFCENRPGKAASYAARFAAKEAMMKILGEGIWKIPFRDIEIIGGGDRRPEIVLHRKAHLQADRIGLASWDLSISHEGEYAIATAFGLLRDTP